MNNHTMLSAGLTGDMAQNMTAYPYVPRAMPSSSTIPIQSQNTGMPTRVPGGAAPFGSTLGADAILGSMARSNGPSVDSLVDDVYLQLSGESAEIARKWRQLQIEATDLQKKKTELRREWAKMRQARAWLEDEQQRFREVALSDEAPAQAERRVRLNVGGQIYETTESILMRDPDSMLAALCRDDSPLYTASTDADSASAAVATKGDEEEEKTDDVEEKGDAPSDPISGAQPDNGVGGEAADNKPTISKGSTQEKDNVASSNTVFIERDGSLFRHILNFLREGFLPRGKAILRNLYREAKYFELRSLKQEIEQRLGLVALLERRPGASTLGSSQAGTTGNIADVDFNDPVMQPGARRGEAKWWERPPAYTGWWPSQKRGEANMGWWTGDVYRGRNMNTSLRSYSLQSAVRMGRRSAPYSQENHPTGTTWDPSGRSNANAFPGMGYSGYGASGFAGMGMSGQRGMLTGSRFASGPLPVQGNWTGGATRFR